MAAGIMYGSYSFMDVVASLSGPTGATPLRGGNAEEGITITPFEDKNTMTVGADGAVMHSLHAGRAVTVTVRLQKTSPINAVLRNMFNAQQASSALWGKNVITVTDVARGDAVTVTGCAFKTLPENSWAKDGNILEWAFDGAVQSGVLGVGTPSIE